MILSRSNDPDAGFILISNEGALLASGVALKNPSGAQ
jgi:hypothetical protein